MLYVYRCRKCDAESPPALRSTAEAYRQQHRNDEHGGLVPAGESLVRVPGSAPDPDGRYVSTPAVLGALALLALAELVARVLGR